jgi:hypothetical protein
MVSLLMSNKTLRSAANDLFSPFGLRLGLRPHEHKIEVIKDYETKVKSLTKEDLQKKLFESDVFSNLETFLEG